MVLLFHYVVRVSHTYVRTVSAYDEYVNPTVGNAFATAAFRFGHSQIQGFVHMKGDDFHTKQIVPFDMVVSRDISCFCLRE